MTPFEPLPSLTVAGQARRQFASNNDSTVRFTSLPIIPPVGRDFARRPEAELTGVHSIVDGDVVFDRHRASADQAVTPTICRAFQVETLPDSVILPPCLTFTLGSRINSSSTAFFRSLSEGILFSTIKRRPGSGQGGSPHPRSRPME